MKLVIDMNLSPRWASFLNAEGFEAQHWSEVADARAEDSEIVDWCREHRCVLMTNDLDFPRMLAFSSERGPSVLLLRGASLSPEARRKGVQRVVTERRLEVEAGAIVTLD